MTMDETWTTVASADAVTEQSPKEVVVGEHILALFRHQGRLYAIDGMCAHQGGPIAQGTVAHGCVTCPWHGWQYELATGIQTINRQPLQRVYEVREQDGEIQVRV
jgi:nitrite reductase (NADH) small subunit